MNLDRDLRDALRPLAGDPVADAQRVLAALPPPGTPWQRWLPPLAVALLLGLGGGYAVGTAWGDGLPAVAGSGGNAAPVEPPPQQPPQDPTPPAVTDPQQDPQQDPQKDPAKDPGPGREPLREDMLNVMAFGPIEIDEPGVGVQQLYAGQWYVAPGTTFRTGDSRVGGYVMKNDVRLRLDRATVATLASDRCEVDTGRVYVDSGTREAIVLVESRIATAQLDDAAGMFVLSDRSLEVLSLRGNVEIRTRSGQSLLLTENDLARIDGDGVLTARERLEFTGTATSWMTPMIVVSMDPAERGARVREMVEAFETERFRAAARREILRLGAPSVWVLADSVARRVGADPDYAREAADLVARLIDYDTTQYVLPLLALDDEDVRLTVFAGAVRATGIDAGTDATFWREAPAEQRRQKIEQWRALLAR